MLDTHPPDASVILEKVKLKNLESKALAYFKAQAPKPVGRKIRLKHNQQRKRVPEQGREPENIDPTNPTT